MEQRYEDLMRKATGFYSLHPILPVIPVLHHLLDGSLAAGRGAVSKCLLPQSPLVVSSPDPDPCSMKLRGIGKEGHQMSHVSVCLSPTYQEHQM